jgi:DNA-binding NtrC family response regulator
MAASDYKILLVEDQEHMIATVELVLGGQYSLRAARSVAEARKMLRHERPDLVLLDLGLPDEPGTELLKGIREANLPLDVIVVTVTQDVSTAVQVMKLGARDYLQKPFEKEDLLLCVQQAYEHWQLRNEVDRLRNEVSRPFHLENIIAQSLGMRQVVAVARKMAMSDANVLIVGESGTGKELIAQAIHWDGTRKNGPFVAVNCAQFTGTLLESELFGHEKGAFTGAAELRKGRFELADGGTLFLDEVGNTSPEMQAKVLRVVETMEFERVGGQKPIRVNVRLIAATNANLDGEMREGRFREDLYYRLNVVRIQVPPLRERKEDIPPLCDHFLAKYRAKSGRDIRGISPEAMAMLVNYDWRGNVRELRNLIEMAVALEEGPWITMRYLPPHVLGCVKQVRESEGKPANILELAVGNFERVVIEEQLRINDWNRRKAARNLGVHRNTIEKKIKKYGIRGGNPGTNEP